MNCGCEARREVMFTQGQPGRTEVAIITVAVVMLTAAVVARKVKS